MKKESVKQALRKIAEKKGKGIYLTFEDYISCDAVWVFIISDRGVEETKIDALNGGLKLAFKKIKEEYFDLPIYCFNIGWNTFSRTWSDNEDEFIRKYVCPEAQTIRVKMPEE